MIIICYDLSDSLVQCTLITSLILCLVKVSARTVTVSVGEQRGHIVQQYFKEKERIKRIKMWQECAHAYASLLWHMLSLGSRKKSLLSYRES